MHPCALGSRIHHCSCRNPLSVRFFSGHSPVLSHSQMVGAQSSLKSLWTLWTRIFKRKKIIVRTWRRKIVDTYSSPSFKGGTEGPMSFGPSSGVDILPIYSLSCINFPDKKKSKETIVKVTHKLWSEGLLRSISGAPKSKVLLSFHESTLATLKTCGVNQYVRKNFKTILTPLLLNAVRQRY